ncbi:hypothetical protein [Marinomonas sp. 2405UD68-3]|uniref:hypothetical protein n=1 Tax=Marinomonas sp. 2405UD68-3 TaxID=3391835 RepID=UPI0039C99F3E
MIVLKHLASIGLVAASSLGFTAVDMASGVAIGEAFHIKTGELLYTETHRKPSEYTHLVTYREATGNIFAEKTIHYVHSLLAPDFDQMNQRNGEVIKVKAVDKDNLSVTYKASYGQKEKTKPIEVTNRLIVDAGFDHYVRAHWDKLIKGETMKVAFLAPTRQITVPFRIVKTDCKDSDSSVSAICLLLSPNSWFFRLVVDPIYLVYDNESKNLQRYLGRGNISEKNGDYLTVDIHYRYETPLS